jgi:hypothetical protein
MYFIDIWMAFAGLMARNFSVEVTRGGSSMGLFYYFNTLWIEHTENAPFTGARETKLKASLQKRMYVYQLMWGWGYCCVCLAV